MLICTLIYPSQTAEQHLGRSYERAFAAAPGLHRKRAARDLEMTQTQKNLWSHFNIVSHFNNLQERMANPAASAEAVNSDAGFP